MSRKSIFREALKESKQNGVDFMDAILERINGFGIELSTLINEYDHDDLPIIVGVLEATIPTLRGSMNEHCQNGADNVANAVRELLKTTAITIAYTGDDA